MKSGSGIWWVGSTSPGPGWGWLWTTDPLALPKPPTPWEPQLALTMFGSAREARADLERTLAADESRAPGDGAAETAKAVRASGNLSN